MFDFSGTGFQVNGNLNTPKAITLSAIIYCIRCMLKHDIPLNQVYIYHDSYRPPAQSGPDIGCQISPDVSGGGGMPSVSSPREREGLQSVF